MTGNRYYGACIQLLAACFNLLIVVVIFVLLWTVLIRSPLLWAVEAVAVESLHDSSVAQIPQEKLDSLLAPVALYPDQLLTQALMASTYPLDVVAAARFVEENKELKGEALDKAVAGKNWDPSVQSLTAYPPVLLMMNEKLDWTQELGDAFLTEEARVLSTVQSLRHKAHAEGNLQSNEQQKVVVQEKIIVIEPAQPQVVYVPTYNPTVVYGSWWAPSYPPYYYPPPAYYYPPGAALAAGMIGFGIGMAIADNHWGWSNANWGGGDINIDIDRNNTFINNNAEFKNRVNNGNWQHNPSQRKGVSYNNPQTRARYNKADPGAVSARRDVRGFDSAGDRSGASQFRGSGQYAGSAGTSDMRNAVVNNRGTSNRDQSFGASAGSRDMQRAGSGGYNRSTSSRPSFDSSMSRQRTQSFSNRGASSRASMGGGLNRGGGGGLRR